ncbi:DUF2493 domain-containing protein [Nesterenkonia rhizosphaerae]|uniref:YspA cpYpsA-related SLOG domain-containing protein n=1 Tax=Nesterenkonia rhizosphaerae TaxID=1348272 RepID=A0ABP9G038_9MICC
MTRILITGSREFNDRLLMEQAIATILDLLETEEATIVHGGARGADRIAGRIAQDYSALIEEVHPADWDTHGKQAGLIRNCAMIKPGADVCLAFPVGDFGAKATTSRGTYHCANRAQQQGIVTFVIADSAMEALGNSAQKLYWDWFPDVSREDRALITLELKP